MQAGADVKAESVGGDRTVTIEQALAGARVALGATSPSARLDAEILLSHVLGCGRARFHAYPGTGLDPDSTQRFEILVERRRQGEPIAYLTERREFWSLDLRVTPDTLIPRPETEHLVEAVLAAVPRGEAARIADIGTGSGAVALALARERPRALVLGSDVSRAAAGMARGNAARLGIGNVSFIVSNAGAALAAGSWSVIVSNPPYVAAGDPHLATGDVRFEPREALVAGPCGLDMLETLAREAPTRLVPGGWLMLEHGGDQGGAVRALLRRAGFASIETRRDLAGHERMTQGRRPSAGGDSGRTRPRAALQSGRPPDAIGPSAERDGTDR